VTVDVPYCAAHARQSRRNTRILSLGWIVILIFSCAVLFGVTTSINRNPPTLLLVLLALVAAGLAFLGSRVLRQVLSRSRPSMADMLGSSHLGIHVEPAGDELVFSFANDEIADQFARLNGQASSA
jgi:threonine/homoserine/homoserine lactone efflux protein